MCIFISSLKYGFVYVSAWLKGELKVYTILYTLRAFSPKFAQNMIITDIILDPFLWRKYDPLFYYALRGKSASTEENMLYGE